MPYGTTVGYSKLAIKANKLHLSWRELDPDPHALKSVEIRSALSSLDFNSSDQRKICIKN